MILLVFLLVVASALCFFAIFIGAAVGVSSTTVDSILSGLPTIVDSLPSQFGASLGDFIDLSDLPAAADIDGSGMMYNGGIVLAGFTVLTLGQLLVLLGFAAGYFGM